jgi:hypothetical protein
LLCLKGLVERALTGRLKEAEYETPRRRPNPFGNEIAASDIEAAAKASAESAV